ncbi:MAG: acyltransferase family protein [Psychromonas sp.]|nr:acyltransferase family protein [Alteromonadales bacterium]MCP5079244.1 acyltransferase family protein [Psychromonas sp.]
MSAIGFAIGLRLAIGSLQSFEDNRFISLALAIVSYIALLTLFLLPSELLSLDGTLAWYLSAIVVKWSWIALIIGFARKHLDHSNKTLKYCNRVVYPFFILHQTVIIVFGFYVIDWGMNGFFEFLIIVIGTFAICALLYELIIKRVNILRLLFGLAWKRNRAISKESVYSNSLEVR